jgi:methyltransferase (TIGR00027 family)
MNLDPVGRTSLWVAAMRAEESTRPDSLFVDPFARALAGDDGFEILRESKAAGGQVVPAIEVRTRHLDDTLLAATASGIRQVVILASGMDARAYRLPFPEGTRLLEVDRPEVLLHKAAKLAGVTPRCARTAVGIDLRESWPAALLANGLDPTQPTAWLVEGLLYYLVSEDVERLFRRVDGLSAPGSVVAFDVMGRSLLESPAMKARLAMTEKLGAPWRYGTDEPEDLLQPLGWSVRVESHGEVGTRLGRWPFPVPPRGTPGALQSFLVRGDKRAEKR